MTTTTTYSIEDQDRAKAHLTGTTFGALERDLGINKAYLSHVKNDRFDQVPNVVMDKLLNAANGIKPDDWHVAQTENFLIGKGILQRAQEQRLCLAMIGTTGFGKSQVAKLYRAKTPNVAYVQCTRDMTKAGFCDAILMDMNIAPQHRGHNAETKIATIVREMRRRPRGLLIIDDAGHLRETAFLSFKSLFDGFDGAAGIVLIGVPNFKKRVFDAANRDRTTYKEIARRIAWVSMGSIYASDVAAVCDKNGITEGSAIGYFVDNVGDFDTLRRLIKTAQKAANGAVITRTFLADLFQDSFENYPVSEVLKN